MSEDIPGVERDAKWAVPWGVGDLLGVLGISAVLTVLLASAIAQLTGLEEVPATVRRVLLPLPLMLLGLVTIGWVHVRHRAAGRLFGPRPAEARDWLRGIGWGAGAFFAVNVGAGLVLQAFARLADIELPQPQEHLREVAADPVLMPWLILTATLIAPFSEELYFRGMLFQALRRRMGAAWSIAVSAVIFAAAHVLAEPTAPAGLLVVVLILPLGVMLGWLIERHGTLVAPIVAHATFNTVTTLVLIAGRARLLA